MLMDIFNQKPFQRLEMTAAFEELPYVPNMLGAMGEALFPTTFSFSRRIAISKSAGKLTLVPTSPIGAPPVRWEGVPGDIRDFRSRRLAKATTIYAEELQDMLKASPMLDVQVRNVQDELAQRGASIRQDIELTHEHMRFGAIMGKVLDADGVTVLDDWYANWGFAEPAAIDFNLDVATTDLRSLVYNMLDDVARNSSGGWVRGRTVMHALCGKDFYAAFRNHPNYVKYYMNIPQQLQLLNRPEEQFEAFGVVWHNFQGTDDGSTIAIPDNQVRFFPVGGNEVFRRVFSPAEFFPFVNQRGRELYAMTMPDEKRGAFVDFEVYTYPLYICLRPDMLRRGILT